jgi:hypothetical protein
MMPDNYLPKQRFWCHSHDDKEQSAVGEILVPVMMVVKNLSKQRFRCQSHDAREQSAQAKILVPEFQRHDKNRRGLLLLLFNFTCACI